MAWAGDAEVKAALAAALKKEPAALPAYMDGVVAASIETAREQIRNAVLGLRRGYTEAQIVAWPSLHSFHRHQSLYWAEVELREMFKDAEGELHGRKNRLAELLAAFTGTVLPADPPTDVGAGRGGLLDFRREHDDALARCRPWCRG